MNRYTYIAVILVCLPLAALAQTVLTLTVTGSDARCNGSNSGTARAILSGGTAPFTYHWAPGSGTADSISGLSAGIYSVTVTDSLGDSATGTVTISQPAPLSVTIDSIVVYPCLRTTGAVCGCGNTLWAVVSGGTPPYSYAWSPGAETGDTLQEACYEEFTVYVKDSNNCMTADSLNVVVPEMHSFSPSGVAQTTQTYGIKTYPNPVTDELHISFTQGSTFTEMGVYDMMGVRVMDLPLGVGTSQATIDVSRLANANYVLKISGTQSGITTHFTVAR